MKNLVIYSRMILAISHCSKVDEVKDIRDKAVALEHYARQATNVDAERQAINVRVRAERRAGEILKGLQKSKGGGDQKSRNHSVKTKQSDFAEQKQDVGITDGQATHWQQMADMPETKFVEKIEDMKRSVGVKKRRKKFKGPKVEPVPDRALWVWGQIKDFEREGMLDVDPNVIVKEMLDSMKPDVRRVVPKLIRWLRRFKIQGEGHGTKI